MVLTRGAVATTLAAVGFALAGAVAALAGLIVHRQALRVGGTPLPWGLGLGLATEYALLRAAAAGRGIPAALGCGGGWALVVLALQRTRPEGDFLVAADWLGYGFVFGGMLTVAVGVGQAVARYRSPEHG